MISSLERTLSFPHWEYSQKVTNWAYPEGKLLNTQLADHLCHFLRATASPKVLPVSQPSVQANFDDRLGLLSHSFSHLFIQLLLLYCWYSGLLHLHSKY